MHSWALRALLGPLLVLMFGTMTKAEPMSKAGASNVNPQHYAILMEHYLSGQKNVRWETRPMQNVDEKGNKMKNLGNIDCMDANGQLRKEGEEYTRPSGKFKYTCRQGEEEVTACVGSDRANKAVIPVGSNVEVNGFWHKCQSFPNGSVVYYQEPSCRDTKGNEVHVGDEFNAGYLRLACDDGGYRTVGCVYYEKGEAVVIREGETKQAGKYTHYCNAKDGNLQYEAKAQGCTKLDKQLKEGETLSENHLHYKCLNGLAEITGCYANEHKDLSVGEDYAADGVLHRCFRNGAAVEYQEYPCQADGCHPAPVQPGPDQVPTLGRGLKAPGVGSFALVQRIGGSDKVQSPQSVTVQLDKILMGRQGAAH